MTTAQEELKILVTRTYDIALTELLGEADRAGGLFANEQWGLWPGRRANPHPWGVVPGKPINPIGIGSAAARHGFSVEISPVVFSWMERESGFPRLSSDLYYNDGSRCLHYRVTAAFYRGFQTRWDALREAERAETIAKGVRHVDSLWAE